MSSIKLAIAGVFPHRLNIRATPQIRGMHVVVIAIAPSIKALAVIANLLPRPILRTDLVQPIQVICCDGSTLPIMERTIVRDPFRDAVERPTLSGVEFKIC